ncbi:hypothetical protein UNPA324_10530 [Bradyrhizobium sp. UNPA324]|nr:hypothetical protein UNPA324_10530 [Bradyrhizobium sp. UNPA324]
MARQKARGIPTKELRSLVKIRLNEEKNRELYEDLEADQQQIVSMLAGEAQGRCCCFKWDHLITIFATS